MCLKEQTVCSGWFHDSISGCLSEIGSGRVRGCGVASFPCQAGLVGFRMAEPPHLCGCKSRCWAEPGAEGKARSPASASCAHSHRGHPDRAAPLAPLPSPGALSPVAHRRAQWVF